MSPMVKRQIFRDIQMFYPHKQPFDFDPTKKVRQQWVGYQNIIHRSHKNYLKYVPNYSNGFRDKMEKNEGVENDPLVFMRLLFISQAKPF